MNKDAEIAIRLAEKLPQLIALLQTVEPEYRSRFIDAALLLVDAEEIHNSASDAQ